MNHTRNSKFVQAARKSRI